ncbi:MAG: L-rhamnose mutarotase [Breznakibacter sp.]
MKTIAYKMFIKPGSIDEYKLRYQEIWPELESITRASGVVDYHIYLDDETHTLFITQTFDESKQSVFGIEDHPLMKKWWRYMAPILESNFDNTPVTEFLSPVYSLKH